MCPAHLGQRGLPDGARSSAAWTCTARLVKVGPLECPGLQASGRAIVERLERAACRPSQSDRRLNAQPPAYVQRELAETRFLAYAQGYMCGRPRCSVVWCGRRVDGGFAASVCRATCRHTPGQDHVLPIATTYVNGGDDEEPRRCKGYASSRPVVGVDDRQCPDLEATRRERTLPFEVGRQRRAGFG